MKDFIKGLLIATKFTTIFLSIVSIVIIYFYLIFKLLYYIDKLYSISGVAMAFFVINILIYGIFYKFNKKWEA